jgi:hypothetical protein
MSRRTESFVVYLSAAVLLAYVLWHGVRATAGVDWPYDIDQFRDVGTAQVLLDGQYPSDLNYPREKLWYNPLTGAILALASWVSHRPAHALDVRLGPYLNLLVPITFFWLCRRLFGKWAALLSLAVLLFHGPTSAGGQHPTWGSPSYSPWLFAPNLSLSWFFLTLLCFCIALRVQERDKARLGSASSLAMSRYRWFAATGFMLGVTFLGHTVPAVILGIAALCVTAERCLRVLRHAKGRNAVCQLQAIGIGVAVLILVAFVVSLPFSGPMLFHYHLKVQHSFGPVSWLWDYLRLENLGEVCRGLLTPTSCVSLFGVACLLHSGPEKRPILYWVVLSFSFLAYSFVHQYGIAHGHTLWNEFAPSYHFYLYLSASSACLFGFGCTRIGWLARAAWRRVARPRTAAALAGGAVLVVFLARTVPSYAHWVELQPREPFACRDTYAWVMRNTSPRDLFLRLPDALDSVESMFLASTRKLVVNSAFFSNPYVNYDRRKRLQDSLSDLVASGNQAAFCTMAREYAVRYVVVNAASFHDWALPPVQPLHTEGPVVVYGVAYVCGF